MSNLDNIATGVSTNTGKRKRDLYLISVGIVLMVTGVTIAISIAAQKHSFPDVTTKVQNTAISWTLRKEGPTLIPMDSTDVSKENATVSSIVQAKQQRALMWRGQWLVAHNSRRRTYFAHYRVSFVPLKWSKSLAASAQSYANTLARTGTFVHSGIGVGENLAWNSGSAPSPDSVLTRWTEDEASAFGGHFTQVLWRATKYLGCGQASNGNGHYQVCHYVTPGNCNGITLSNMLARNSPCLPQCPSEGCI